ncbi:MAG: hypothetical protein K9N07_08760 [Candidatus Cloacimonetes bacterium]|nr:hypothetical protein [Candidatus Cloacimonadota bacterium]MCF8396473.1 hypothetical protein [Melioribacteraceae bacterium]
MDNKILFYGYGNPGRQDDALGIRFIDALQIWVEEQGYSNIFFESNYQLNIEDADTISNYDLVYFVDATVEEINSFGIMDVELSNAQVEFTMHAISPGVVLSLCKQIYNKVPVASTIHIRGFEWELEFDKGLTKRAEKNLQDALKYTKKLLEDLQ